MSMVWFSVDSFSLVYVDANLVSGLIGVRSGELGIIFPLEMQLRSFTADDDCLRRPEFRSYRHRAVGAKQMDGCHLYIRASTLVTQYAFHQSR